MPEATNSAPEAVAPAAPEAVAPAPRWRPKVGDRVLHSGAAKTVAGTEWHGEDGDFVSFDGRHWVPLAAVSPLDGE